MHKVRVPDYEGLSAKVSSRSTIEIRCILYTVPSRLIKQRLDIHLYHDRLIGYFGTAKVFEVTRVRPKDSKRRARSIDYRHAIEGLRKKPRAFLYCTWQQELLLSPQFRQLWEQLKAHFDRDQAAIFIVEALYLAATHNPEDSVIENAQTLPKRLQFFRASSSADPSG